MAKLNAEQRGRMVRDILAMRADELKRPLPAGATEQQKVLRQADQYMVNALRRGVRPEKLYILLHNCSVARACGDNGAPDVLLRSIRAATGQQVDRRRECAYAPERRTMSDRA